MRRRNREPRKKATMTRSTRFGALWRLFWRWKARCARSNVAGAIDAEKRRTGSPDPPRSRARDVRRRVRRLRAETPRRRVAGKRKLANLWFVKSERGVVESRRAGPRRYFFL